MISLNQERIQLLAQSLQKISLPPDFRQRFVPAMVADEETACLTLLWVTAICHATKGGLKGRAAGREVKGTEYLLAAFCATATQDPASLSVARIKSLTESELRLLLTRFVTDPVIVLSDLDRRAEILRELASEIEQFFAGRITNLLVQTDHRVGGTDGFYACMDRFSAFRDLLKKKSGVFLYFLEVTDRWRVSDVENLLPMIDYHIIRLFCRTGCLEIQDESLRQKLRSKELATDEEERVLRQASFQIHQQLGKVFDVPERGELLYLLSRSYCRNTPVCISGNLPENDSFDLYTETTFHGACPLQKWCPGACQAQYRDLWEPTIQTENYSKRELRCILWP